MLRIRLIETFDLVTSGGACSCVLGSLTVVFFTVFLQRDLHFALGNFTVRFTIWGKEDREGEGVYENVLNLHSQHVSIVRQGFRWMTFTFSPLCPRGLKDAFKVPLKQITAYTDPPVSVNTLLLYASHVFPFQPVPSSLSWHPLCQLWGLLRSLVHKRRSQGGELTGDLPDISGDP